MRQLRASVIALSLLTSTATAHAECAWVLWATVPDGSYFLPLAGFNARGECETRAKTQNTDDEQRFCER